MVNTSVSATTAATTQNQYFNPLGTTNTMSTDFFGSQVFGNGIFNPASTSPSFMKETPKNSASALLHNYYQTNGGANPTGAATMQDYYIASQIANQFANNSYLISPYSSFFQNDFLAQQLIPPSVNYSA